MARGARSQATRTSIYNAAAAQRVQGSNTQTDVTERSHLTALRIRLGSGGGGAPTWSVVALMMNIQSARGQKPGSTWAKESSSHRTGKYRDRHRFDSE
jgi:hypothetical protein